MAFAFAVAVGDGAVMVVFLVPTRRGRGSIRCLHKSRAGGTGGNMLIRDGHGTSSGLLGVNGALERDGRGKVNYVGRGAMGGDGPRQSNRRHCCNM